MTLATKNGAIILKDGKLAENCGCCGGWYCCPDTQCALQDITSATVVLSSQGYLLQRHYRWECRSFVSGSIVKHYYSSAGFDGASLTGSFSLTKQGAAQWGKSISMPGGCTAEVALTFGTTNATLLVTVPASAYQITGTESYKSISQLTCVSPVATWSGAWVETGDEARQTLSTLRSVTVPYGTCFSVTQSQLLPLTFNVQIPYFAAPSCDEITSTGIVATASETGQASVTIQSLSLG